MASLRSPVPLEDIEPAARPVDVAVGGPLSLQDFFRSQLAEWLMERYRAAEEAAGA